MPPPRPKIPPEYANVAKKLTSELPPSGGGSFEQSLDDLAKALGMDLDNRSSDLTLLDTNRYTQNLPPSVPMRDAIDTVKEAGVFAKTKGVKVNEDIHSADFEVGLDELLQGFKEPKKVEGSGSMVGTSPEGYKLLTGDYKPGTGVLMGEHKYSPPNDTATPGNAIANTYPLNPRGGHERTLQARDSNETKNELLRQQELNIPQGERLFLNKPPEYSPNEAVDPDWDYTEAIPQVIPPLAAGTAAAVALSSSNAEAKSVNEDKLTPDLGAPATGKISLTSQVNANARNKRIEQANAYTSTGAEANSSPILSEIKSFAEAVVTRAKGNLTHFAKDIATEYNQYKAEKDQLAIRAQELINNIEAKDNTMLSDEDRELIKDAVAVIEGNHTQAVAGVASGALDAVSKFNQEALQPIIKTTQGGLRKVYAIAGGQDFFRKYAPSLAVLGETVAYPLIGNTGWNLVKGEETNQNSLDPTVVKLMQDKTTLLGSEAGAALMSAASGYKDLPMWLIGGSSKLGLILGGVANELFVEDSKDSNLARGGVTGLVAGTLFQKLVQPLGKLAGKIKLDSSGVMDAFGKVTYDSNPQHIEKVWNAFMSKFIVEPMLMMTGRAATKMADDAMIKATPDVTDAFKTKVIAPQALVLSIEPATGKPIVYGVKDGLYGILSEHVNPEGRPVLINQIAKQEWMDNKELVETWNKLVDPKRKTPPTRANGIDEWTPDLIPPENPALVFAWKNAHNGEGMMHVYRVGSREFTADLLRSRALVRVEYDGPNGEPTTGLGYYNSMGNVVFAPDATENIPGAIPRDLVFKQTRLNPNVPAGPLSPENMAWEITPLNDTELYSVVDDIKARDALQREAAAEITRGNMFPDGVPIEKPPNPFDNGMHSVGPALAMAGAAIADNPTAAGAAAAIISFLPPAKQAIGKALAKANNAAGRIGLISDTVYGEKFKIDASIQAFSLRHYKRLTEDLNKQLVNMFKDAATTPLQRQQFNDELKAFIEGNRQNPPVQLIGDIQKKVQKYVAERNYEYALIESLGGTVPDNAAGGNKELERMFALDYFEDKAGKLNPWLERMRKQQPQMNGVINLLGDKAARKQVAKQTRQYDSLMGRMSTEMEMADDYMNRKLQLNQLGFMKELADNVQASSPIANQMLGHTKQVDFNGAGMLKGKWVSEETYKAIHTYPQDQKMLQNTMLGVVNMIKFNKTVLNPTTWVKNIMGNVWGVMNSNIVSSWNMAYRIPRGIRQMRKDLAAFNKDVMSSSAEVQRAHETLKFGLMGAEFESSRTKMLDVLDNLAEPIANTSNKTWGEKLADGYFKLKDNTLGAMAHAYSNVDMATKYSLYVNGLERWGIDLSTNKLANTSKSMRQAADLLGASVVNDPRYTRDVLTDMIKREIVRRIHLSLPMVDRIGPVPTALNKLSPITNPWLRTASELTRITLQMPYRMYNEKGYAVNALKTASFLGAIIGINKALRLSEGISDEVVDDAKAIAPRNIKDYMPGATATRFYAGEGKDRGIVFVDFANGLVEPAQLFKGGEVNNGVDVAKRLGANGIDLITGGGLLADESKEAQAALGLTDTPQNYGVPFWKQGDTIRYATNKAMSVGPQVFSNAWQLYSTEYMPDRKGVRGADVPRQPMSMVVLKSLGIPVATMGSEKQREYKLKEISNQIIKLKKDRAFAGLQREGSSTGSFQKPYTKEDVKTKIQAEIDRLEIEKAKLEGTKPAKSSGKIDLLSKEMSDKLRTPHM